MRPTPEQEEALEYFLKGNDLKLTAVAGSGKTTTLRLMGESAPGKKLLYLAFNRSVREEARRKLPPNTEPRTLHSLAYGKMKDLHPKLMEKMRDGGRVRPYHFKEAFGLNPIEAHLAKMVLEVFLRSPEKEPSVEMVPEGVFDSFQHLEPQKVRKRVGRLLGVVKKAWGRMQDPSDPFPLAHDGYVKIWASTRPRLEDWDAILLDEAQDLDPIFLGVLESQTHAQRVYVGDPAQQIYAWRGAVNAMAKLSGENRTLSWSFRFDETISALVRDLMDLFGRTVPLQGKAPWKSYVMERPSRYPYALLTRTNLGLIDALMNIRAKRPHVVGGVEELKALIRDAKDLYYGRERTNPHPELLLIEKWEELETLAEEAGDSSAKILVSLAKRGFGTVEVYLESVWPREEEADVILSTVHKAKGREWDRVYVWNDFPNLLSEPKRGAKKDLHEIIEEQNILYVALTRARRELILPLFVEEAIKEKRKGRTPVFQLELPF